MITEEKCDLIIEWYLDLEERLSNIIKYVPYNSINSVVELPLLSSIIIEAGSLIDTIFREGYDGKKKQPTIIEFAPFYENEFYLSKSLTIPFTYPPIYLNPYSEWVNPKTKSFTKLKWWADYNKIKHSRIENSHLSTLDTAVNSVCALHQLISKVEIFIRSLMRHDLLAYILDMRYLLSKVDNKGQYECCLVETKLFATPFGKYVFPKDISKVSPANCGGSKRLSHLLGKNV